MPGEAEKARFNLPEIQVNQSGWGPSAIETKFKDMPYQPFSKSDRLGKVRFQTHNRIEFFTGSRFSNPYQDAIL